jgi:hypothetical protein
LKLVLEHREVPKIGFPGAKIAACYSSFFGAGASYDTVPHLRPSSPPLSTAQNNWSPVVPHVTPPHEIFRPPLANHLFDDRRIFVEAMKRFKDCMAIVPLLRKPGISVEQELAKLQEQAKTFPQGYRELVAVRYYLHSALWDCQEHWRGHHSGITNYVTLLREIERCRYEFNEQVCLVTFNYDTMLEDAAQQEPCSFIVV